MEILLYSMDTNKLKIIFVIIITFILSLSQIVSQEELLSAKELLQKISDNFKANIKDYKAEIKWIQKENIQLGTISFKNPQKMRIDFIEPKGQVICTNGYELWLYIEYLNLVLHENLLEKEKIKNEEGLTETIINPVLIDVVGLDKFLSDYSIEYHETKERIYYKDKKQVYQLKLIRWRSSKNGFNIIYLTVQENGLIRKVEGITAAYRHIILEIDNYEVNNNISDLIFNYKPPPHSSTVENFITTQEEVN